MTTPRTLADFIRQTDLSSSLLIGYYGGGNYGDELLLEVLGNLLARKDEQGIRVAYQHPRDYRSLHHDFGFTVINIHSLPAVLRAALHSKRLVIGGGGLWGVDINTNTLLLSVFLFMCRWLLGKKVYLLGVGYYNSTTSKGRLAAWFAGKAANLVIARDPESVHNFSRISKHVVADTDIAWQAPALDPSPYREELEALNGRLPITSKTLLVAFRRPQARSQHDSFVAFNQRVSKLILSNPERPIVLLMLESEAKDPAAYEKARSWMQQHKKLRMLEVPYNPLTLFWFIQQHHKRLAVIAPQFHVLLTAHLAGVPFLPIVYDNKVTMLFDQLELPRTARLSLDDATDEVLQSFSDQFFGGIR